MELITPLTEEQKAATILASLKLADTLPRVAARPPSPAYPAKAFNLTTFPEYQVVTTDENPWSTEFWPSYPDRPLKSPFNDGQSLNYAQDQADLGTIMHEAMLYIWVHQKNDYIWFYPKLYEDWALLDNVSYDYKAPRAYLLTILRKVYFGTYYATGAKLTTGATTVGIYTGDSSSNLTKRWDLLFERVRFALKYQHAEACGVY